MSTSVARSSFQTEKDLRSQRASRRRPWNWSPRPFQSGICTQPRWLPHLHSRPNGADVRLIATLLPAGSGGCPRLHEALHQRPRRRMFRPRDGQPRTTERLPHRPEAAGVPRRLAASGPHPRRHPFRSHSSPVTTQRTTTANFGCGMQRYPTPAAGSTLDPADRGHELDQCKDWVCRARPEHAIVRPNQ